MNEVLPIRYSNEQLQKILDEATIYMCACPAQVAKEILLLRELFDYQRNCIAVPGQIPGVHERIAQAAAVAHMEMERCLDDILRMEGWDMQHLAMPPGLRQRRDELVDKP